MDNKIIDKFLKFIEKDVVPPIKKDFTWLAKTITKDLGKLTKEKKLPKKRRRNHQNKLFILNIPRGRCPSLKMAFATNLVFLSVSLINYMFKKIVIFKS